MPRIVKILGLCGSLRKTSYNAGLLRAAREVAPDDARVDVLDSLRDIPLYDEDVRAAGYPAAVERLREAIRDADALLFASPEFNRAMSGVLKNAIDWVSRPPSPPFHGKPACVMTAATGALAGSLANYDMRQVLSSCGVWVMPGKEIMVGDARTKFDGSGALIDGATRDFIAGHVGALVAHTRRLM